MNAVVIAEHLGRILKVVDDEAKARAADVLWDISGTDTLWGTQGEIPILADLLSSGKDEIMEKVSGAITHLSYAVSNQVALVDAGTNSILICLLYGESEELRDNPIEALINFFEDLSQLDRISEVIDTPFRSMRNRMVRIRDSAPLRRMSIKMTFYIYLLWIVQIKLW